MVTIDTSLEDSVANVVEPYFDSVFIESGIRGLLKLENGASVSCVMVDCCEVCRRLASSEKFGPACCGRDDGIFSL